MTSSTRCFLLVGVLLFLFSACGRTPKSLDPERYVRWIDNEAYGLSKHRKIGDVNLNARYLPGELLAYRESVISNEEGYDSLLKSYRCSLSFQVQLQADKSSKAYGNLMYHDVASEDAFKDRSNYLNFRIQEFISLKCRGIEYEPVLSNFEGYDQLGNRMSFQVVFVVPDYDCGNAKPEFGDMTLTFNDPYWSVGTVNFEFDRNSILSLPKLKL